MSQNLEKETAIVEAVLYLESDPIDEGAISRISGLEKAVVAKAVERLAEKFNG